MSNTCWTCNAPITAELFCPSCHKIQEPRDADPFHRLHIPYTFDLDLNLLQQKYFQLQNLVHPDRYSQASDQEKRFAQQQAEAINMAYQQLKDPVGRAKILLQHEGLILQAQTPAILTTMMEWQEKIAEASTAHDLEKLLAQLAMAYQETYQRLEEGFKNNLTAAPELAGRLLYLTKIQQQLLQKKHAPQ